MPNGQKPPVPTPEPSAASDSPELPDVELTALKPNAEFWLREDEWELHDAALLLLDVEPRAEVGRVIRQVLRREHIDGSGFVRVDQTPGGLGAESRKLYDRAREIVRRIVVAARRQKLSVEFSKGISGDTESGVVEPLVFVIWARDKGYEIPNFLQPFISEVRNQADLEREVAELRAKLVSDQWPWGNHSTRLLTDLAAAATKWWVNFDPADITTAPTSEQVAQWLVKERRVPKRVAEVIAQILRADTLPKGPRR